MRTGGPWLLIRVRTEPYYFTVQFRASKYIHRITNFQWATCIETTENLLETNQALLLYDDIPVEVDPKHCDFVATQLQSPRFSSW